MEFLMNNSTDAMKGKGILQAAGIRVYLGKRSGENGCYYYLKIADRNKSKVLDLLEQHGLLK